MGPAGDRVRKTFFWFPPPPLHHQFFSCKVQVAFVLTEDHWGTWKDAKCRLFPAPLQAEQRSKGKRSLHTWGIDRIRPSVDLSIQTRRTKFCPCRTDNAKESWKKTWEMFHEHFTFHSVSLQEKAKETLVDKDFQDMKSLLSENRVSL